MKLSFYFLFFLASAAQAATDCLEADRVKSDIYGKYQVQVLDSSQPVDLCKEQSVPYRVFQALFFLQDLNIPAIRAKDSLDLQIMSGRPFDFFQARVKKLIFDERADSGDCSDGRVAYIAAGNRDEDGEAIFCPPAAKVSLLLLSGILLHEARHLDGPQFAHQMCRSGSFVGRFSCDSSYEAGGSYGVGAEYSVRVWRAVDVHPALRAEARAQVVTDMIERFNEMPLDLREGAFLLGEDGTSSFYDGEKQEDLPFSLPANTIPTSRQGLVTFFQPAQGKVVANYFGSSLENGRSDVLTKKFLTEISEAERKSLKDMVYGSDYACLLLGSVLDCVGKDRVPFRKEILGFVPKRILYTNKSKVIRPGMVHIAGEDGFLYFLPAGAQELRDQSSSDWKRTRAPYPYLFVAALAFGTEIGLTTNGGISLYNTRQKKWSVAPGVADKLYRFVISPFVWSEKLQDL